MDRIDRRRLEKGTYPHRCQVPTRYSDLDPLGHVNNVAGAEILQEARYQFVMAAAIKLTGTSWPQLVVAASHIDFAADLFSPYPVEVATGVLEIGRTSFRLGHVARQRDRISLYAETVQVARDASGPTPLPDPWRIKLASLRISFV